MTLLQSIFILFIVILVSRHVKRGSNFLKRYFIPSSLLGGLFALILGPQLIGTIPIEVTSEWVKFPGFLINIVFAGLFLGHSLPKPKEIINKSIPMIAFGNTLAWGQYVIGILLTIFILGPFFGAPAMTGALIEIGFEGGHGTASGLAPTFTKLGWSDGTGITLGLATVSIIVAIISCLIIINVYNSKNGKILNEASLKTQQKKMIRSGYNITRFANKLDTNPKEIAITCALFVASIFIGWFIQQGFISIEDTILKSFTDLRFFKYIPLFPLAMMGGIIVQLILRFTHKTHLLRRNTIQTLCAMALDILIVTAIATMSLNSIKDNLAIFIILAVSGVVWILSAFFLFAPRFFKKDWFEKGITNVGQSMGMTATGLLINRLVDPYNKTKAREAFAYKQLAFEPFMGGGLITASMVVLLSEFGLVPMLIISSGCFTFWIVVGLIFGKKDKNNTRLKEHSLSLGKIASKMLK